MVTRNLHDIPPGHTKCSAMCGSVKDNTCFSFYKNRRTNNGYRLMVNTNCIDCQKIIGGDRARIKKKFKNIAPPPFDTPCELCKKPVTRNWQLDHSHGTIKEFRGWLCKPCNTGLGNLGDDLQSVRRAVEYLERAENHANPSQQNLLLK